MKLRRFVAPDMRQAIRLVRETLGSEAVILSNRRVKGGIEIVAATNYEMDLITDSTSITPPLSIDGQKSEKPPLEITEKSKNTQELHHMQEEMRSLRAMLQDQLAGLAWREKERRTPFQTVLLRRLYAIGIEPELCRDLVKAVSDEGNIEQEWQKILAALADKISTTNDDILTDGEIVALVGTTGVGKTTTIAKLAARYALRHGVQSVALITMDSYRIGAHEQLKTYAKILGSPIRVVDSQEELSRAFDHFHDKKLILIDTAGMSPNDLRLKEQLQLIQSSKKIKIYLVLAAVCQSKALDESIKAFYAEQLQGSIITKLDEAVSLGPILSALVKHKLRVSYITHGQRVPEDLRVARAYNLVNRAVTMSQQYMSKEDQEILATTFSGEEQE